MDYLAQLRTSLADRYEIDREIGAGGMATVYLARDLRHDRNVALKVLKPDLGAVLGVERFLAEIKVTANLQHPNLLPLFDSGEAEGLLFYVMPYVEGETLRTRLDHEKQLPIDEAIRISVAVASALDYAHSHGVIHRDLKPENILLQAGQPVIADFGIALAVSKAGGNRITQTGLSLGTPNYMSPEQATGDRIIDGRSDIYSLGAMTYEMLTGEPPHTGNTSQAVIARMLTEKPRPIRTTRSAVPEYVEETVQRALEKLPADRFSTVREFADGLRGRIDFATGSSALTSARRSGARPVPGWRDRVRDPLVISLSVLSIGLLAAMVWRSQAALPAALPVRFVLATPDSARAYDNYPWPGAISPDGSTLVYSVLSGGQSVLVAQRTNQLDGNVIPGTRGAGMPTFSPDGQLIAFESQGKVRKVRLDGSAPIAISDGNSYNGLDWSVDDELILGSESEKRGLSRVSASGGDLVEFAKPDSSKGETDYLWPITSADGKTAAFAIWSGSLGSARLATVSIDNGEVIPLDIKGIRPLAIIDRVLVYLQLDGQVMGVRLDRSGRHAAGRPVPVHDPVGVIQGNNGNSQIFISRGGALLTSRGGTNSQLAWITLGGSSKLISNEVREFEIPRLSPDGSRIAMSISEQKKTAIWIYDLHTGTFSRLSSGDAAGSPSWMPDSKRVVYIGAGDKERFAVYLQDEDGGSPATKLFDLGELVPAVTVSPDGKNILYVAYANNSWQLFRVSLDSPTISRPYLASSTSNFTGPAFSPDGKWALLSSNESGQSEVYIRSFPNPTSRVQVSAGGGDSGAWSADGTRIFYTAGTTLMSAHLATTPSLRVLSRDTAIANFAREGANGLSRPYDIARDGRFLTLQQNKNDYQLVVVPNWLPELKQRLAGSKRK